MVFEGFEVHRGFGDSGLYNTKRRVPEKPRREATGPDPTPQNFSQGPVPKSPLSNICPVCVCVCARVVVFVLVSVFVFSFFVFFFSTRAHQAPAPPPKGGSPSVGQVGTGTPATPTATNPTSRPQHVWDGQTHRASSEYTQYARC
jgi:hypothetical protein